MAAAEISQESLNRFKQNIEKAYVKFKRNYDRYHEFQRFTFKTNLTSDDEDTLEAYGKPVIEANIVNAYVSRLCGEYSKQEPSIIVRSDSGDKVDEQTLRCVEDHLRHIIVEANKDNTQYNVYRDQLTGGFSTVKVYTEYASEGANQNAFDQVIKVSRVYEPTLCGFDPMAQKDTKSDAEFFFELYPMSKTDFKVKFPDVDLSDMKFIRMENGFSWAYEQDKEDVLILCDYYELKRDKRKIVKLANDDVMFLDEYKKKVKEFIDQGHIEQPPAIVGKPRDTEIKTFCRYRMIGTKILQEKMLDFKYPSLVFFDGDSVRIREDSESGFEQFTKPYVYHGKGMQRLKNLAMQCLANHLETQVMHKFMVPLSALPQQENYLDAYTDPQKAQTLVYNDVDEENPSRVIAPPSAVPNIDAPATVTNTFTVADQAMQGIFGSYDAALGINDNQLSGVAIVEGATQSNAAAMPYVVNNMGGWTQVAQIIVDLIPKYYKTPRTIPLLAKDGTRSFQKINQPGGVNFNYDENALQVQVEAGVNFAIAKNKALQQIIALMGASKPFDAFMNQEGLEVLLDNMEFRGVDIVKEKVDAFTEKMKAMEEKAMNQPNPDQIKAQIEQGKLQMKGAELQAKTQESQSQMQLDMAKLQADMAKVQADLAMSRDQNAREAMRAHSEHKVAVHDQLLKHEDQKHRHAKEVIETAHGIHVAKQDHDARKSESM